MEKAIYEEIEKLKKEPIPAEELQKVKNQAKANAYRRLSSPFSIAIQLMIYDGFGDWRYINTYAEEVDRVTAADLQRVAKAVPHQGEPHGRRLPAQGGRGGRGRRPEIAAAARAGPGHGAPADRAASRRRPTPPSCARASPRCRRPTAQVPPEMKPAFELILKRAQERLAALEGGKK